MITDNAPVKGVQLAQELGEKMFALRGTTKMRTYTLEEALAQLAQAVAGAGPIVLADMWDNPGVVLGRQYPDSACLDQSRSDFLESRRSGTPGCASRSRSRSRYAP